MFIFIQLIRQILKQPSLSAWVQSARYINQCLTSRDIPNTIHIPIGRYKFYIIIIIFIFVIYFYICLEVFLLLDFFTSKLLQHPPVLLCCSQSTMVQAVVQYLAEEAMEWLLDQTPNLPGLHRHTHAHMDLHLLAKMDNGHENLEIDTTIYWNIALYYKASTVYAL